MEIIWAVALTGIGILVGMGLSWLIGKFREKELADLKVPADMRVRFVLGDFFERYLSSVERALKKDEGLSLARLFLADNPTEQDLKPLKRYWVLTVEELRKRDREAADIALLRLKRESVPPYSRIGTLRFPQSE